MNTENENEYLAVIYVLGDPYCHAHGPTPRQAAEACAKWVRSQAVQQWKVSTYRTGGRAWTYCPDRGGIFNEIGDRVPRHSQVVVDLRQQ